MATHLTSNGAHGGNGADDAPDTVHLNDIALFVEVVRRKSFSLAARALGMPTSTLSRRIGELERAVGMRLLNRNTRRLDMTDAGAIYFERCQGLVDEARLAHEQLLSLSSRPQGRLTLCLPHSIGSLILFDFAQEFTDRYPELEVELDLSQRAPDPDADRFDVMLRLGEPVAPEGMLVQRLLTLRRYLYASEEYVARHGEPRTPAELANHECLRIANDEDSSSWELSQGERRVRVQVSGRISVTSIGLIADFAGLGLGIAPLSSYAASSRRPSANLRRVLPDWDAPPLPLYAIFPSPVLPAKTRAFMDFIRDRLVEDPGDGSQDRTAAE
jgi:DNA-binding transcriptional LysR family regulator